MAFRKELLMPMLFAAAGKVKANEVARTEGQSTSFFHNDAVSDRRRRRTDTENAHEPLGPDSVYITGRQHTDAHSLYSKSQSVG